RRPDAATIIANVRRIWRRSLQVRVVTITLAASGVLVITFGFVVGAAITTGLIDAETEAAKGAVEASTRAAQDELRDFDPDPADPDFAVADLQRITTDLEDRARVRVAILPEVERPLAVPGQPPIPAE